MLNGRLFDHGVRAGSVTGNHIHSIGREERMDFTVELGVPKGYQQDFEAALMGRRE